MPKRKANPRPKTNAVTEQPGVNWRVWLPGLAAVGAAVFAVFILVRTPEAPQPVAEIRAAEAVSPLAETPLAEAPAVPPLSTLGLGVPVELNRAAEAKFIEGVMLAEAGELEKSIAAFQEVRRLEPMSMEPLANIGRAYVQLGRFDDALRTYEEAVRLNPHDARMIDMLGVAYAYKGNIDGALAQFRRAIGLNPYLASAYSNAGLALMKKSNGKGAMKMLEQAIVLDPSMTRAYGNLAELYLQLGMENELGQLTKKLQAASPDDPAAAAAIMELLGSAAESGSPTPTPVRD